jgi:hypothetical protein
VDNFVQNFEFIKFFRALVFKFQQDANFER